MVMHLVHIGRNKNQADRIINPFGQFYIGVTKLRRHYRKRLIKHDDPDRGSYNCHARQGEEKAHKTF